MTEDVDSAIALLGSADEVLRQLDDTDLLAAREAITRDLAALRAVPAVDVEGTWLRLQALAERLGAEAVHPTNTRYCHFGDLKALLIFWSPAVAVDLCVLVEVVAVLADPLQLREDALVVHAPALKVHVRRPLLPGTRRLLLQ